MSKLFCTKVYTGKGMITKDDMTKFKIQSAGYGNVWMVENNVYGQAWVTRNLATLKTKEEAQAIVDGVITGLQNTWDADNEDGESAAEKNFRLKERPISITLTADWS